MQKTTKTSLKLVGLLSVSLLIGLSSCKKDKHTDHPPPVNTGTKIKEYKNGDEFVRFTYNADGTIKKATVNSDLNTGGEVVDFNISYNAEKKISEINTSRAGEKIVPVYENGVLTRADYFDGPVRIMYTSYNYQGGKLMSVTMYLNQGADFEPFIEFGFTYDGNGNLTKTETFMATDVPNQLVRAGHVTFQHDQKTNPLYEHRDFLALLWQAPSKNNIVREEHFDAQLQLEDVISYAYTYKGNGLPEKAVVSQGMPGETPATSNVDFTYQ